MPGITKLPPGVAPSEGPGLTLQAWGSQEGGCPRTTVNRSQDTLSLQDNHNRWSGQVMGPSGLPSTPTTWQLTPFSLLCQHKGKYRGLGWRMKIVSTYAIWKSPNLPAQMQEASWKQTGNESGFQPLYPRAKGTLELEGPAPWGGWSASLPNSMWSQPWREHFHQETAHCYKSGLLLLHFFFSLSAQGCRIPRYYPFSLPKLHTH